MVLFEENVTVTRRILMMHEETPKLAYIYVFLRVSYTTDAEVSVHTHVSPKLHNVHVQCKI